MPLARRTHVALPDGFVEKLHDLATRIDRNTPSFTRPEDFHAEKDEIRRELLRLARTTPR